MDAPFPITITADIYVVVLFSLTPLLKSRQFWKKGKSFSAVIIYFFIGELTGGI